MRSGLVLGVAAALSGWLGVGGVEAATQIVSLGTTNNLGNGISGHAALGAARSYVVFSSTARNLVPGDTNGAEDAFYRNLSNGVIERLSVSSSEVQGNAKSLKPVPSADGTIITFQSEASNLVAGDTNGKLDIFVRNRTAGTTERASVSSSGAQANGESTYTSITPNGRYVIFQSTATNLSAVDRNTFSDIYRRDRQTGQTVLVSVGLGGVAANGNSAYAASSADGRYIAFQSLASNLVAGDTNRQTDVFVRDMVAGTTARVTATNGTAGNGFSGYPDISDDGRYVAFISRAQNFASPDTSSFDDLFVHDRTTGVTTRLTKGVGNAQINGHTISPEISGNGLVIVFGSEASNLVSGDTNRVADVFTVNRTTGIIRRMSVGAGGQQGAQRHFQQHISQDGASVVFSTASGNLVTGDTNGAQDVFLGN